MIIGRPNTNKPVHEDNTGIVETSSKPARRIEVDTERLNPSRLIQHAEGSKWTTKAYLNQRVGADNVSMDFDTFVADPSQQYRRVERLIIRVTSPLTTSQDTDNKDFTVTGEGFIDHGVIPNKNDVFIADIGDGQFGLLLVTNTERLSYRKEASYRIEYQLKDLISDELEKIIDDKVSETLIYSPENLERSGQSLITEETYTRLIKIKDDIRYLQDVYAATWHYMQTDGYALPEQIKPYNDGFLELFLPYEGIERKHRHNYPPFKLELVPTLWSMLMKPHRHSLKLLKREMGLVEIHFFRAKREVGNIGFSQYHMTMWSDDMNLNGSVRKLVTSQSILSRENPEYEYDWGELAENKLPPFAKITLKPYILSEGFYDEKPETELERLILAYVRKDAIDPADVIDLYDNLFNLQPLEQFYYSPIVLLLMHYVN